MIRRPAAQYEEVAMPTAENAEPGGLLSEKSRRQSFFHVRFNHLDLVKKLTCDSHSPSVFVSQCVIS